MRRFVHANIGTGDKQASLALAAALAAKGLSVGGPFCRNRHADEPRF